METSIRVELQVRPDQIERVGQWNAALGSPLVERALHSIPEGTYRCVEPPGERVCVLVAQRRNDGPVGNRVRLGELALILRLARPGIRVDVVDDRLADRPM